MIETWHGLSHTVYSLKSSHRQDLKTRNLSSWMGPTGSSVFLGVCNTRNLVADDPINMIAADKRMFPAGTLEIISWLCHVDLNWHEWHFCKMDTAVPRLLVMFTWHGQPHTGHSSNSSHCQDFNTRNLSSWRCPTGSQIKLPRCSFDCAVVLGSGWVECSPFWLVVALVLS